MNVLAAFRQPDRSARPGWEPLDDTRRRVADAVGQFVDESSDDVMLVGHGTAWTLLLSELTGAEPDLTAWTRLRTPDLCTLNLDTRSLRHRWGEF